MQALILLDFMLSLTPKAKARLSNLTNKSVLYGFVLNDEDVSFFFFLSPARVYGTGT